MSPAVPDAEAESPRDYLDSLAMHGIKLGLSNIQFLLERAGHPERTYPTVHVAGTNGKGSVVAFLAAMLSAAGYRAGRFTSPHLIDLRERFLVDAALIPEAALVENIRFFQVQAGDLELPPTFFELNTAVAFRWFEQQAVDLALIEVGLGGRLDSTNVLQPEVCAVTSIDLEHTEYLGDTLEKIAWEKGGIIKPGVPVVIGERKPGPRDVLLEMALEQNAAAIALGRDFECGLRGGPWDQLFTYESNSLQLNDVLLGLHGSHQAGNAAVAVAIAEELGRSFPRLNVEAIARGLSTARWPGRMEKVIDEPSVIMDVAHNAGGARRLAEAMPECVVVFAASADKDVGAMLAALGRIARPLILTTFSNHRCLPLAALSERAGGLPHLAVGDLRKALEMGMTLAREGRPLLVTGSIYMAGEAREMLMQEFGAAAPAF